MADAKQALVTAAPDQQGMKDGPPPGWDGEAGAATVGAGKEAQLAAQKKNVAEEELEGLDKWGVPEVQAYFDKKGFGEWAKVWEEHEVTGERVVLLTPLDIKDLGIASIGDRMGITSEIEKMKTAHRKIMRNEVKQIAHEAFEGSCIGEKISTCCGCFPRDPDKYTLTRSRLSIEDFEIPRICGTWKCMCLGGAHSTDNIQLDMIRDVDTVVSKKGCWCCAVNKAQIHIAVGAGNDAEHAEARVITKTMFMEAEEGEEFANLIFLTVEEYKSTFRKQIKAMRV